MQTPAKHYQDIVCDNSFNETQNKYTGRFGQGLFDNLVLCSSHIAPQLVRFLTTLSGVTNLRPCLACKYVFFLS